MIACVKNNFILLGEFIYDFQSLIAGLFGIFAALITIFYLKRVRDDEIYRKSMSARAAMPTALSSFVKYSENCIERLESLHQLEAYNSQNTSDDLDRLLNLGAPDYSEVEFNSIKDSIEYCHKDDAFILADFLALLQIQHSRLKSLFVDLSDGNRRGVHRIITSGNIDNAISDALGILLFAERIFDFARRETDHIGAFCSEDEAVNTLSVRFVIRREDLLNTLRRNWPPMIRDRFV